MTKAKSHTSASSFRDPDVAPEARKDLIKQIEASNLSDETKALLTADINNDDPAKFEKDGGMDALQGAANGA
jgi:hypothetical protein